MGFAFCLILFVLVFGSVISQGLWDKWDDGPWVRLGKVVTCGLGLMVVVILLAALASGGRGGHGGPPRAPADPGVFGEDYYGQ